MLVLVIVTIVASFTYPLADEYIVDLKSSNLKWTGYHLAKSYEHWGNIDIKSGTIGLENGDLVSAEIIIDMNSLTNKDLESKKDNTKLVNDLKSKRFFDVKEYPVAKLVIKNVLKKDNNSYNVTADITIRGITKEIGFIVKKVTSTDSSVKFTADLEIDRIEHKVMYGWSIENAMLSNTFDLQVEIVANREIN